MKKMLLALLAAPALLGISATISQADPTPSYHLATVSRVIATRNNANKDDRYVTLIGHVTGRDGNGTFLFTDGTGTIRLDSKKLDLPIGPKIVVDGRIDRPFLGIGNIEVDVSHWRYVKRP